MIYDAESEARKRTASATSSGLPIRPEGISSVKAAISCGVKEAFIEVPIIPGETQFTVIPEGATSLASALVKPIKAAFDAE